MNERDLPQPGLDELDEDDSNSSGDPTEGPGNVSVDEPTEPALNPDDDLPSPGA